MLNQRAAFALGYALRHLLISVAVALLAALLVFRFWYPVPTSQMLNVSAIYAVLLLVDVVCGPLLTLVLASPVKPQRELVLDLSMIALIQLGGLGYGLHTLESARPVAYVFEGDRLVIVSRNELYTQDCADGCMPIEDRWGIQWMMVDLERLGKNRALSLDLSLQGVSPAVRQSLWREWEWKSPKLQSALLSLNVLSREGQDLLLRSYSRDTLDTGGMKYLPMVSSKTLDWIAVFDSQGQWMGAFPIDGFQRK